MYQCIVLSFAEAKMYLFLSPESYTTRHPCLSCGCGNFPKPGRDTQASEGLMDTSAQGTRGLVSSSHSAGDVSEDKETPNPVRVRGDSSSKPLLAPSVRQTRSGGRLPTTTGARGTAGQRELPGRAVCSATQRHLIPGAVHEPTAPDVTSAAGGSGSAGDTSQETREGGRDGPGRENRLLLLPTRPPLCSVPGCAGQGAPQGPLLKEGAELETTVTRCSSLQ